MSYKEGLYTEFMKRRLSVKEDDIAIHQVSLNNVSVLEFFSESSSVSVFC